jgi:hypothetical protein
MTAKMTAKTTNGFLNRCGLASPPHLIPSFRTRGPSETNMSPLIVQGVRPLALRVYPATVVMMSVDKFNSRTRLPAPSAI